MVVVFCLIICFKIRFEEYMILELRRLLSFSNLEIKKLFQTIEEVTILNLNILLYPNGRETYEKLNS